MPKKPRSPEEVTQICADYLSKSPDGKNIYTIQSLCKKFRISKNKLFEILAKNNIPKRLVYLSKETEKNIISDYLVFDKLGFYLNFRREICKKYKISQTTLDEVLRRNKVKIRRTRVVLAEFRKKVISDYLEKREGKWRYTILDITEKYKINSGFIYQMLQKEGVTLRRLKKSG